MSEYGKNTKIVRRHHRVTANVPISKDKLNYQRVIIFTLGVVVIGFALRQRILISSVKVFSVLR